MKKILVTGGGGFIGGHLVKELIKKGYHVRAVDIKNFDEWYQVFDGSENFQLEMSLKENCTKMVKDMDEVINMACNMGGMGFIENNKALCMLSVLVNTHLLMACRDHKIKKYFFHRAHVPIIKIYKTKQMFQVLKKMTPTQRILKMVMDGKTFSERMCRHFLEDYGLDVKVARYHNIYGPHGTYDGGREKAPAALCRKIIYSEIEHKENIDVWGDGEQTRSFLYIDDCVEATLKLFNSKFHGPINIGSEEKVSINEMIDKIELIANKKVNRNYQLDKPKGVRGRNSDNNLIRRQLNWEPRFSLSEGLAKLILGLVQRSKKHNQ